MKKAISVFAIVLLLISMLSPIVRADITLTSEFTDPLKNWSFEERPIYPQESNGIFDCLNWSTNIGNYRDDWRELKGDINGDGNVTLYDATLIGAAYGSRPGDPQWNPYCDLDGDEWVYLYDAVIVLGDYGKVANRVDGSYSWYTSGGGNYEMWQWLSDDTVEVIKGKEVAFSFWYLPESVASNGSLNNAQAGIFYEYNGGSNTTYGTWATPTDTNWTHVCITADLPSTTTAMKVIIHGEPDFKAWIDLASLSITETKSAIELLIGPNIELKISLTVNLFESKDYSMPIYPCRAFLGVAMATKINMSEDEYYWYEIDWVELKIKLITGASVTIRNVTQSNDFDEITDPDQTEEIENKWITAGQLTIKGLMAFGMFALPQLGGPYHIGNLLLSLTGIGATSLLLPTYRSDADTPFTETLGEYAKARINYEYWPTFATERGILELAFASESSCQIEVTATARFIAVSKIYGIPVHLATLEESILVTVSL